MKAALAVTICVAAPAFASAPAPPPPEHPMVIATDAQPKSVPPAELGVEVAFGLAHLVGIDEDAWTGRFQYHLLGIAPKPGEVGAIVDIGLGYDYWRVGPGTWGMDLPVLAQLGVRANFIRVQAGIGLNVALLDRVHGDTGFGLYAPLAAYTVGVDLYGFTLLADGRITRRWQFGADDFTEWAITLGVGFSCQFTSKQCRD